MMGTAVTGVGGRAGFQPEKFPALAHDISGQRTLPDETFDPSTLTGASHGSPLKACGAREVNPFNSHKASGSPIATESIRRIGLLQATGQQTRQLDDDARRNR
ncbi:MAG: hypothetical protein ABI650_11290 [Dokdonella sp.]